MLIDLIVFVAAIAACLVIVFLFIFLSWYVVWELFLKKFKFIQELIGKSD